MRNVWEVHVCVCMCTYECVYTCAGVPYNCDLHCSLCPLQVCSRSSSVGS